jgi:hypothetical protein
MNVQSPQFLTDLYSDLRDRRLLPLIVVLLAGMVVVPIALSSSPKSQTTEAATATAAPVANKSPLLNQQVALSDPGIRKYQTRLRGDAATDPFLPRVQGTGKSSNSGGSTTAATGGLTSTSNTSASSGADVPLTAEGQAAAAAANGSTAPTAPVSGSPTTPTAPTTQSKFFFYRIKTKAGEVGGDMKVRDNVDAVTSLPSDQVPALAFLGVSTNSAFQAQTAIFLVNSGVSLVSGTGTCSLTGTQCQLVALKPGEHADVTWTDGKTYRVTLVKFNLISRSSLPGAQGNRSGKAGQAAPAGNRTGEDSPLGKHFSF